MRRWFVPWPLSLAIGAAFLASVACGERREGFRVIDGDTVEDSSGDRLRLSGIDAPEMPGHCRPGRRCVPGDPIAAREALRGVLARPGAFCVGFTRDFYGRLLVRCWTGQGDDVNAWMIEHGFAQPYRRSQ